MHPYLEASVQERITAALETALGEGSTSKNSVTGDSAAG
jgi:hypothetical protein